MDKIQKINQKFYDKNASQWASTRTHTFWLEKPFKKFATFLQKGDSVVDIGCSYGFAVPLFLGIGRHLHYTGIDISKSMLKIARSRYPHLIFRYGNIADKKTLPKSKFNAFWAGAVFMHIPKEQWGQMFDNMSEILKPGGFGFFSVPERRPNEPSDIDHRYFEIFTGPVLQNILKTHGWKTLATGVLVGRTKNTDWRWYIVRLPK